MSPEETGTLRCALERTEGLTGASRATWSSKLESLDHLGLGVLPLSLHLWA